MQAVLMTEVGFIRDLEEDMEALRSVVTATRS